MKMLSQEDLEKLLLLKNCPRRGIGKSLTLWPFAMLAKLSLMISSYTATAKNVAGTLVKMPMGEYLSNASPPKKIAATIRHPRSRAKLVAMVAAPKPQTMFP